MANTAPGNRRLIFLGMASHRRRAVVVSAAHRGLARLSYPRIRLDDETPSVGFETALLCAHGAGRVNGGGHARHVTGHVRAADGARRGR